MKVLIVGNGGREHALAWKISQSPKVQSIYCAPGNGGISEIAECINIPSEDVASLVRFAKSQKIDLTVVGPEVPLVLGIVDEFEKNGLRCFGPGKDAAEIEGSKVFSKKLMKKYNIPTAEYEEFNDSEKAKLYLKSTRYPVAVKADGLAGGKGVVIAENYEEACSAVESIMEDRIFNEAGSRIIIEEYLEGPEVSILAFTDGKTIKPMASAKDHKRVFDDNKGPNTGGMGTISPNPYYGEEMSRACMESIFIPTIKAMEAEGRKFKGVLFFGLMLTKNGPKVLEYNCRFGDPETQVVLPRLKTDLVDIMEHVIDEKLDDLDIEWSDEAACCVIASSGGYPGSYEKGKIIYGLDQKYENYMIFHSGTRLVDGNLLTSGGRVLAIVSLGNSVRQASDRVYELLKKINFEGMHYRKDIGRI